MAYRSCMMPTAGFENPPSPPSNGAGSLMNASSSNNCGQQTNHLLMMTPNRLTGPLGVRPMSDNGFSLKEPCNNRWSAVNGLGMSGQSSTAGTSGSLQFSDAESQRCSVTEMQGLLQRPPCHSYSGRPNQCVVQKRDSGREQTGSSGYAVFDVSAYSASDLRQNQSNVERSAAVLQEDHHFSGGHVLLLLPQETSSPVVGPTDRYTCRSSIALQQSSVGNWSFNDEIIVDSADGISQKSSNQKVSTSAAGAAAAGCPSSSSSLRRRRSQTPSDDNSSFGLSNQLMTKPTLIDCAETTHQSAREGGIELCNASNQPPSVIISSSLASSPTVKNNSHHISPDSALNDLLCLSAADDDSLVKESSGKATTTDGFCSNAIPSVCLLEKSRTVADKSVDYFGEDSPTDGHDSEKQSLINSFPRTEKSCRATEPRICSSVAEADRSSHLTDENFCEEKKLTVKRENSIIDDKLMSVRRRSPCAFAASNSFHALEIGAQVDGCNNGRDSTEEQSTGVNPPLDHPPLPPPAPPLPASLENANKEAVEASAVASVVDDNALFQSSAAAATTAVISRSLTCLSPAITNKGETNKSAERGLNELVSGEEEERGRGKRKRKVMSYSRYLEMSSSDDEGVASGGIGLSSRRKCLKTSHALMNSSSSDPIENSVAKTTTNGQQRKSVAASSSSRCRSNDVALVSVVDRDRRSSDVGNASTDIKSRHHLSQGSSASSKDSPVAAGQMSPRDDEQNARSALCPPASVPHGGSREKNSAAVAAKEEEKEEEAVDDKQQQQQQQHRVGREKELELEVTNENGEVEIVTIVDLHSSSDEADLLAMNGEDEIIPLTDNESDDAASSDCEHRQPDVSTEAAAAATAAAATAAAAQSMMQSVQKERLNCSSVTAAASSAQTPRVGLDLMHSASRKVDSKGRSDRVEQEADDMLSVAGPSHETKTSGTDRTTANKKPLRKKRKRVRPGDEFSEFGSDVEDNDKVHRLKKMYGSIQKQTKPGKTIIQMQSISAAPDKTTSSASGSLLGPYIRLIGSKETPPVSCKVVNVKDVDLDAPHSKSSKKSLLLPESSCVPSSLKFLDSVPWICLFCGHGSAYSMLGDLFGPYYPQSIKSDSSELKPKIALCPDKQSPPNKSTAAVAADKVLRSPRRLSSRLRTNSCDSVHEGSGNLPQELWVHEQCAVWTSGVYVARGKLQGLEEAAVVAAQVVCSSCHRMGATLGCYVKGCSQNYHYLCAVKAGCFFQEENFSVLCPKHRDKSRKLKGGHTE